MPQHQPQMIQSPQAPVNPAGAVPPTGPVVPPAGGGPDTGGMPAGPAGLPVGGGPDAGGPPAMATPEQIQELKQILAAIQGKISEVNTSRFAQKNAGDVGRKEALREMFMLLQQAGVDLTNPQSVSEFLAAMRQKNPELAQTFEDILNQLLGGEGELPPTNEINNEAIPQNVPGPLPEGPPGNQLR